MAKNLSARDRMKRAKVQLDDLEHGQPFFGYLVRHLDLQETQKVPTMAVDFKGNLYYNPTWVKEELSEEQVKGVLCHEVMHLALRGEMRRDNRDHELWNVAQDIIINHILKQNDFQLPEETENPYTGETERNQLVPQRGTIEVPDIDFKIENLDKHSFESVYNKLQEKRDERQQKLQALSQQQQQGKGEGQSGGGSNNNDEEDQEQEDGDGQGQNQEQDQEDQEDKENGEQGEQGEDNNQEQESNIQKDLGRNPLGMDDHITAQAEEQQDLQEKAEEWEDALAKALTRSKQMGNKPSGMERRVEELLYPQLDWTEILSQYISKKIPHDYTWQKPSKKSRALRKQGYNTYLPDTKKEGLEVAVAVDLSGSVGDEELAHYLGEIASIVNSFEQVSLTVIQHDAAVTKVDEFNNTQISDIQNLELKGGGGTNHVPVFEYIEEEQPDTEVLICLTDGYTQTPDKPPMNLDTIWVVDNKQVEKERLGFGRLLRAEYNR